jgi:tetratricopeptide (TPR) repeat protein
MLNAAVLIDPENRKIIRTIVDMRDSFVKDLVLRLEKEIENDFPDKLRDAEKLMITNQMVKAEKVIGEINVEEPNSARAFYIKGLYLYLKGSLKESHKLLTQALEVNANMEKAVKMEEKCKTLLDMTETASQEMKDQKYSAAIETFTKAIEFDPENKFSVQASVFQRALANFNMGNFNAAFEDYKTFESMKKVVGNVLQDIEVPDAVKEKKEKAEKEAKAKKSLKKKKKSKKHAKNIEVKVVTKLQTLVEEEEFEHDSQCELSNSESETTNNESKVENAVEEMETVDLSSEPEEAVVNSAEVETNVENDKRDEEIIPVNEAVNETSSINDTMIKPSIEIFEKVIEIDSSEPPVIQDFLTEIKEISPADEESVQQLNQGSTIIFVEDNNQAAESNDGVISQDYGAIEDESLEREKTETSSTEEKIKEEIEMKPEPASPTEQRMRNLKQESPTVHIEEKVQTAHSKQEVISQDYEAKKEEIVETENALTSAEKIKEEVEMKSEPTSPSEEIQMNVPEIIQKFFF